MVELLVMAKAPVAGQVKTRMQPHLSAAQSASLQRWLLRHSLQVCRDFSVQLYAGSEHPFWAQLATEFHFELHYQAGQDLGERMANAFAERLVEAEAALMVGSDCYELDAAYLQQAERLLQQHDVVLGPAADGGYVLIGLKQPQPALFEAVSWGSDKVFQQTLSIAGRQQLAVGLLDTRRDVDRVEDLQQLPATWLAEEL